MIVDYSKHLQRRKVLEPRPTQIIVGTLLNIFTLWKNPPFHWALESVGFIFFQSMG
jgi:hypothetical protein